MPHHTGAATASRYHCLYRIQTKNRLSDSVNGVCSNAFPACILSNLLMKASSTSSGREERGTLEGTSSPHTRRLQLGLRWGRSITTRALQIVRWCSSRCSKQECLGSRGQGILLCWPVVSCEFSSTRCWPQYRRPAFTSILHGLPLCCRKNPHTFWACTPPLPSPFPLPAAMTTTTLTS